MNILTNFHDIATEFTHFVIRPYLQNNHNVLLLREIPPEDWFELFPTIDRYVFNYVSALENNLLLLHALNYNKDIHIVKFDISQQLWFTNANLPNVIIFSDPQNYRIRVHFAPIE